MFPGRLRWALPGSAVACALAGATPLVVLHRGRAQVSQLSDASAVKAPCSVGPPAGVRRPISSYATRAGGRYRWLPTAADG